MQRNAASGLFARPSLVFIVAMTTLPWFLKRRSLIAAVVAAFMIFSAAAVFLSWTHYRGDRERILKHNRAQAEHLSLLLEQHFFKIIRTLESYANRPLLVQAVREKNADRAARHLLALAASTPGKDVVFITDREGVLWARVPAAPEAIGLSLAFRDWYRGVSKEWQPYVSGVFLRIVEEKDAAVVAAVPIFDGADVTGILVSSLRLVALAQLVERVELATGEFLAVVDQKGSLVYSSRVAYDKKIVSYEFYDVIQHYSPSPKDRAVTVDDLSMDGEKHHISYASVPALGWAVVVEQEARSILLAGMAYYVQTAAIAGLLFALTVLLLVYVRRQVMERRNIDELRQEAELRVEGIRYRELFDGMTGGVTVYQAKNDGEDFVILDINKAGQKIIGVYADFIGRSVCEIFPGLKESGLFKVFQDVWRTGRPMNHPASLYRDGAPAFWTENHVYKLPTGEIVAIFDDITERKRAEGVNDIRLRLFEYAVSHTLDELLQETLDEICQFTDSPIGFFHFVEADQQRLTLQSWSTRTIREFCQASGKGMHYNIEQAGVWTDCVQARKPVIHNDYPSLPHRKGLPAGHAAIVRELVVPVLREGKVVTILGIGNKPDDYTQQDADDVSYLADVVWTIIAHKRTEQRVYASEQRQKSHLDLMTTLICEGEFFRGDIRENIERIVVLSSRVLKTERTSVWVFDDDYSQLDCTCLYNRAADSISEGASLDPTLFPDYTRELLEGRIIAASDVRADSRTRDISAAYFQERGIFSLLDVPVWAEGKLRAVLSFEDAQEKRDWLPEEEQLALTMASFVSYVFEAEQRVNREREIMKLNEDLERRVSERTTQLEAVNKELEAFSYSVSHDLRAPLRGIDGFSQALLEDYANKPLDETGAVYLARIRRATQHMGVIIDEMLRLARVTKAPFRRESVDLSPVAGRILHHLKREFPERRVEANIQPGVIAQGDPYLLEIVLTNLLNNAWKFTGKTAMPCIEFGVLAKDGKKVFFVQDNGAGFDMAYADKLFGAFQRLHKSDEFPGTGIGLATVRRIVNRHGGHIWAEAEVGKGATFYFTLS